MKPLQISIFRGEDVTDDMLQNAAKLFTENYGVWGPGGFGKLGESPSIGTDSQGHY